MPPRRPPRCRGQSCKHRRFSNCEIVTYLLATQEVVVKVQQRMERQDRKHVRALERAAKQREGAVAALKAELEGLRASVPGRVEKVRRPRRRRRALAAGQGQGRWYRLAQRVGGSSVAGGGGQEWGLTLYLSIRPTEMLSYCFPHHVHTLISTPGAANLLQATGGGATCRGRCRRGARRRHSFIRIGGGARQSRVRAARSRRGGAAASCKASRRRGACGETARSAGGACGGGGGRASGAAQAL